MTTAAISGPITLCPVGMSWIKGAADDPSDLCVHGRVDFRIAQDVLIDPATCPEVSPSAAALFLMRTLARAHTKAAPVGDQLFPCCGHAMWDLEGREDVELQGCGMGLDFEVSYAKAGEPVQVRAADGRAWRVTWSEWQAAVFRFADQIAAFYARCSPKLISNDELRHFGKFTAEWERRRGEPLPCRLKLS